EHVIRGNEFHVLCSEGFILARVTDVPGILLRHDVDDGGFLVAGKTVHRFGPNRDGNAHQEDGFDDGDDQFDVIGGVAFDAFIIRLLVATALEAPDRVPEVNYPADEQRQHEPVNVHDQGIDGFA